MLDVSALRGCHESRGTRYKERLVAQKDAPAIAAWGGTDVETQGRFGPGWLPCRTSPASPRRIRIGRQIGSAALIADGLHARTDGFTSLAVVAGAAGVAVGWGQADPIIGLVITVAILAVLRSAARDIYRRLMDAVDPAFIDAAEQALSAEPGVLAVRGVRMRWIGHELHAEAELSIDPATSLAGAHHLAHEAEHALTHAVSKLTTALVHAYPAH